MKVMWRRPLVRLLLIIPLTSLLLTGGIVATWFALGQPQAQGTIWFQVTGMGAADARYDPSLPDRPFFFLALGNDARTDADPGLGDAIHVIGVNPALGQAAMLDVPRDTTAPSGGKINSYHSLHGLPGITDQLERMMGIHIDFAITTNFPGIVGMVDEIGGIDVNVPFEMNDLNDSGALFHPGLQHLTGDQVLRFSRDRHNFANGDITRTNNQGIAILGALATLRAQNPGPAGTMRLVAILARHVRARNMSILDLYRLARLGLSLDPANIKNITIPVASGPGTNLLLGAGAASLFADFRDDGVLQTH